MKRNLQLKEKKLLKEIMPKMQPDNWLIIKKLPTAWHIEQKRTGRIRIIPLRST